MDLLINVHVLFYNLTTFSVVLVGNGNTQGVGPRYSSPQVRACKNDLSLDSRAALMVSDVFNLTLEYTCQQFNFVPFTCTLSYDGSLVRAEVYFIVYHSFTPFITIYMQDVEPAVVGDSSVPRPSLLEVSVRALDVILSDLDAWDHQALRKLLHYDHPRRMFNFSGLHVESLI